jgi:hypothetical protein
MSDERATPAQWDVLTAELRSYREQQKQTWGELDNALIGRYLAGEVTDDERRTVETALKHHPELQKLTDIVLDVLNEFQPSSSETPASPPRLLSFTDGRQARRPFRSRLRERGALVAAACVLLALGVTLLKVPGTDPVTHVARHHEPEVAHLTHARDLTEDEFPLPREAASSIKAVSAVEAVKTARVEDIDKVAAWTERRLRGPLAAAPRGPQRSGLMLTPGVGPKKPGEDKSPWSLRPYFEPAKGGRGNVGADAKAPPPPGRVFAVARKEKRDTARELEQAAPYLAKGLCQEVNPYLSDRCGKALVRMASSAGEAVPVLKKALEKPASPKQQQRIVEVLKYLGPAANDAAPQLALLAERGPAAVRAKAREALRSVCVGVIDQGEMLSVEARHRLNERATRLSRQHVLYFSAQTYRRQPAGRIWNYTQQVQASNGRTLSVAICADSQAVEVTLSPDLAGKDTRLNAAALRQIIQDNLRHKTPEKGLEQAVELVERELSRR